MSSNNCHYLLVYQNTVVLSSYFSAPTRTMLTQLQFLQKKPALPILRDLTDTKRQQLTASLQQQTSDIQKKFQELVTEIMEEMQRRQVPLKKLIKQLKTGTNKDTFSQATSIQDVFSTAATEGYWSFFN